MKAYILNDKQLVLQKTQKPELKANQILVKTRAVSLNPVDYKVIRGAFNLPTPRIIGIDVAGEVVEIGKDVDNFKTGNRVCAMVNIFETGSFADYVAIDANVASKLPDEISYEDASTIPCAGITAWQAINDKINLQAGQMVFITGGNGGVGSFAIQFAKRKGAKVITTASKNFEYLKKLGADFIINYKEDDIAEKVMIFTKGNGVDYFINSVSAQDIEQYASLLRFNGTIIGITGIPDKYPFTPFSKAAGMAEVALIAAYTGGDKESLKEVALAGEQLAELIADGTIKTSVSKTVTFEQLPAALQLLAEEKVNGKIVVSNE